MIRAALLASVLAACGGGGGGGGMGDDGDDAPATDGGTPTSGKIGSLFINSYSYATQAGTTQGSSLSANFLPTYEGQNVPTSGCYFVAYTGGGGTPTNTYASAGAVTFQTSPSVTLTPGASAMYAPVNQDHPLAGTIAFTVAGDEVPAFTGSITVPTSPTLTAPAIVDSRATVNRSTDLSVTWTGGSGEIAFSLTSVVSQSSTAQVTCLFDASAGRGTVPANLLGMLTAGNGSMSASVRNITKKSVGGWTITLGGLNSVRTSSGAPASAALTLQ